MTITTVKLASLTETMNALEKLALSNENYVFRGHQEESWKIGSTLSRYTCIPHQSWDTEVDEMLSHFIINALSIGSVPFKVPDKRSRLEYGRHYGVPTPLIDFSWSPYVALFFAFNGVRYTSGEDKSVAIYALNLSNLAHGWAKLAENDNKSYNDQRDDFIGEGKILFEHGYPGGTLKFIRHPASWNQRMQRQLGCFLYDTLDYDMIGFGKAGLEGLIDAIDEPKNPDGKITPTLTKFIINWADANEAFSRLELMNITATRLIDHEGLAADVKNSYNYNRKTGYSWDIVQPLPDDTKM